MRNHWLVYKPIEEVIQIGINGILVDMFKPQEIAECVMTALSDTAMLINLR